ncbi:MAG: sulfatase-like hydrolase/transferase [Acidobacteria bacterium]|nr:sulfatase-like hydrolase/transferase [Acidobacteriota bacterium]
MNRHPMPVNDGSRALARREFLDRMGKGIVAAAFAPAAAMFSVRSSVQSSALRKPNIVLILADDLGYAELGCQGGKDIATPNIDSIARAGVRFTQGYVTCPICAPTRAALLTGRYQQRFGFETNPGPEEYADEKFGLPLDQPTLAERLKPADYVTGMVGKWHLGYKPELTPPERGFDEFFGFLSGAHNYLPGGRRSELRRGLEPTTGEREYLTDAFAREAVAFIQNNKDRPFFLYLPFNAVHAPLEASEEYLKRVESIKDATRRTYAAMTLALDDAVGRVLETLRKEGLQENTLIFFLSDNGGPTSQTTSSNAPLRGYKGQVWEGGIRVPFLVQWKGQLPEGMVFQEPVSSLDIVPTVLAATGIGVKPEDNLDGANLLPSLKSEKAGRPHDVLYWRSQNKKAIRLGDWKLVKEQRQSGWELYNLADDIGESKNLAEKMPEKVKELEKAWQEWNAQLQAPKWIRQDARTAGRGAATRSPGTGRGVDVEQRFRQMDRNGDGKLNRDEVGRPALFRRLDLNGDGVVTMDEAKKALIINRRPAGENRK